MKLRVTKQSRREVRTVKLPGRGSEAKSEEENGMRSRCAESEVKS